MAQRITLRLPFPWQQFVEPADWVLGDTGQDMGEPSLRVDVVHFGTGDHAVDEGSMLPATVGSDARPRLAAKSNATRAAFGGDFCESDAAVIEDTLGAGSAAQPRGARWNRPADD